ncbi:YHS domain protein [Frigidibacter sp. RF13]|uniref:YHS domain-containing (seleno)protein n=1 Tax=Frigidibacter sp. RF13 TaxID=2997340 RepID=UPI00226D9B0C|nr:YHS domain-containing (seleno)protein [Frigidibacter sp. RF13]MCY1128527.1 YHS domain protein [Frigidibacter sp. RF13]
MMARMALGACVAAALMPLAALAEDREVFAPGGIAMSGYDVVAYFTEGAPVEGEAGNAVTWRGVTWYFASPEALMSFEMDPEAYAPQFGGHCAYGLSEGHIAAPAPTAFFIHEGKLYFMHTDALLAAMGARLPEIVAAAEGNWASLDGY